MIGSRSLPLLAGLLLSVGAHAAAPDAGKPTQGTDSPAGDSPDVEVVMTEDLRPIRRLGAARLTRNQVLIWRVRGTAEDASGTPLEPLDTAYIAYDVAGVLRFAYGLSDWLSVGGDVGASVVPGLLGGPGVPFGGGLDLQGHVTLGNNGTNISPSPVGLVLGGGIRGDVLWLNGLSPPTGADPVVFGASPMVSAEIIGSYAGFVFGIRGDWRHQISRRFQDGPATSTLRVSRYGGGIVFGGAF